VLLHELVEHIPRDAAEPRSGDAKPLELARIEAADDRLLADLTDLRRFACGVDGLGIGAHKGDPSLQTWPPSWGGGDMNRAAAVRSISGGRASSVTVAMSNDAKQPLSRLRASRPEGGCAGETPSLPALTVVPIVSILRSRSTGL